jgi:dihydrodipicolinate synthase/N-acetylneuraminate lyase
VLNGSDETILTSLANGARGLISCPANIMPGQFAKLYQAHKNGKFEEAQKIQQWINLVLCQLFKHPLVPAVKQVMCWQGYAVGPARRPSRALTTDEQQMLRADLEKIGFQL